MAMFKELGHVSTSYFSHPCGIGGEPNLGCGVAVDGSGETWAIRLGVGAGALDCASAKVENWTKRQWNAAKQKWSRNKAKWNACNQDLKDQKLSGRKSWSYLYECMTKA
jgi:hypothetical protein